MLKLIKEIFQSNNKLSDITISTYSNRMEWLRDELKLGNNLKEITEDIGRAIYAIEKSKFKTSTKKLTYIILSMISKKLNLENEKDYNICVSYYKDLDNYQRRRNVISEERKKSWTSWRDIWNTFYLIDETKSFDDCQDKLIVGLYTRCDYTLRLDWSNVLIESSYDDKRTYNHIVKNNNIYYFVLINYKTSKNYGKQTIKLDNQELENLMNYFFNTWNKKQKYLLVSYKDKNKSLNENSLSKRIPKIFAKYINKSITNQILREIKESDIVYGQKEKYNKLDLNQKYSLHKKLFHSYCIGSEYAKK